MTALPANVNGEENEPVQLELITDLKPVEPELVSTYLCCACWRRIPVGMHAHACFYKE